MAPCHRLRLPLLALAAALVSTTLAASEIYRWRGDDGTVHYGAQPPTGADAERVDIESGPPPSERATTPDEPDAGAQESEPATADDAATNEDREPPPLSDAQCDQLERNLTTLESRPAGVLVEGADGETRRLDQAERRDKIEETRELLANRCP